MILFSKKLREKKRWESKRKALLKEDTFYEKKFDEHNIRYLTAEDVLRKLKEKNISIPRKDELNILVIFKHHNWEKFSLIPALEKFGNVHHFDWSDHIVDIRKFSQKLKINELLVNYFGNLHEMQKQCFF